MLKKRLLWQLYPSFLLIIIISVVGVAWYASQSLRNFHLNQIAEDLESRAHLIEKQILDNLEERNFTEIDDLCRQMGAASSTRITVILPDGEVIADSDESPSRMKNHADRPEFKEALERGSGNSTRPSETLGKKMMYQAIPIKQDGKIIAVVRTSVPVTAIDEALTSIYSKLVWAGVVIAVFAAAISLAISKKISRPVEQMTEVAQQFASGQLDLRLIIPDATELAELARALNEMARQLNSRIDTITKERSQIQAILSSMIEGVLAVDSDGNIVSINKAAAELLSIDAAKSQSRSIEEVIRNPDVLEFLKQSLNSQQPTETYISILENGKKYFRLHGARLTDEQGNTSGAVIVLNDVTRIRRLEGIRRDFVANVSHELKTPITSIKGFVETLLEGAYKNPKQTERFLKIIAKHSDRLNAIVDDLLSLSRLEEDSEGRNINFEKSSLKKILDSSVELSKIKADEKNIRLRLDCDSDIMVHCNPPLLEQAVVNLIDNAAKYSEPDSKVIIKGTVEDDNIIISVKDDGCGIDNKYLDRIFERFYVIDKSRSRKLGGTGLGLAIVKHIIQIHKGSISVSSKLDKGSTFTITLPSN